MFPLVVIACYLLLHVEYGLPRRKYEGYRIPQRAQELDVGSVAFKGEMFSHYHNNVQAQRSTDDTHTRRFYSMYSKDSFGVCPVYVSTFVKL
ncbi:hypothetical protein FB446DRAFT_253811 [Lentinula raphanica]|nr:hypothetical protein FB446DRAFT_253811 [Lentinula raphanica]